MFVIFKCQQRLVNHVVQLFVLGLDGQQGTGHPCSHGERNVYARGPDWRWLDMNKHLGDKRRCLLVSFACDDAESI